MSLNLENLFEEFLLTFSTKISLFSSKKIERCITFLLVCILIPMFIWYNRTTLSAVDFTIVIAPLVGYAMYNTHKLIQEKNANKNEIYSYRIINYYRLVY